MQIYGVYEKTLNRNEYSASTFFSFIELKNGVKTAVHKIAGIIPSLSYGTPLLLDVEKDEAGYLRIRRAEPCCREKDTAKIFLKKITRGIGEKTAASITDLTGPDIYRAISDRSVRAQLRSCGKVKKQAIEAIIRKVSCIERSLRFIEKYKDSGISYPSIVKVLKAYEDAEGAIISEPYSVGLKCGIPFSVIDSISGKDDFDPMRVKGAVLYALKYAESDGDTKVSVPALFERVNALTRQCNGRDDIPPSLIMLEMEKTNDVVKKWLSDGLYVGSKDLFTAEQYAAVYLHRQMAEREAVTAELGSLIKDAEEEFGIRYSERQKKCFDAVLNGGINVVTGGPGTGKTTVMKGLIRIFQELRPGTSILLCAPTGRAAKRLAESTGMEAFTIHKALNFVKIDDEVTHKGPDDQLVQKIVIVDEASMLDSKLFCILLSAMRPGSTLVLVGDPDQLPSVGAGNILYDLIQSGIVPVYALDRNYRQASGSQIITCAQMIKEGKAPVGGSDVSILYKEDHDDVADSVIAEVKKRINEGRFDAAQVLCSTKKGPAGTVELNTRIQELMNFRDPGVAYGRTKFHVGDRIIMTTNCYEDKYEYHNGDLGVITGIGEDGFDIRFLDRTIELPKERVEDMMLAYAITIHKSQGSEFEDIIISLPDKPAVLLNKKLLYTAVTRGKKSVEVVSGRGAIYTSVKRAERKRETWLPNFL